MNVPFTLDQRVCISEGMEILPDGHRVRDDVAPGASWWSKGGDGQIAGLTFCCPCGCKTISFLPIKPGYHAQWHWDGNEGQPSLTPSVQKLRPCKWHGYLTKGIWQPV